MDRGELPPQHGRAIRILLRYAAVMGIVGILAGVAYQESSKRLSYELAAHGLREEGTLRFALLHGHVLLTGVVLPIACAVMLALGPRVGGRPLGRKSLGWLLYGYLPHTALALVLLLAKGLHFLRAAYGPNFDVAAAQESFFGGHRLWRHSVYGYVHFVMGLGLVVFLVAVYRSLGEGTAERSESSED